LWGGRRLAVDQSKLIAQDRGNMQQMALFRFLLEAIEA
jgi:hypothetical protein